MGDSQYGDAPVDPHRLVRIAVAHLELAARAARDPWAREMLDAAAFNARRTLPEHESIVTQRESA